LSMYADQTERRAAENALRGSQALLSRLLATSPDLIALVAAASGRFVMINDSFTRVLGYGHDGLMGKVPGGPHRWQDLDEQDRLGRALQRDGKVQNLPFTLRAKSGAPVPMLVSAAGFEAEERRYIVVNARDVSETERT